MKLFTGLAIAVLCVACGRSAADDHAAATTSTGDAAAKSGATTEAAPAKETLREVTIPAGTVLHLKLQSAIASDTSHVEDNVHAELRQAVAVDGKPVLPAGTEVAGTVTDVQRSGRVKGRARIAYQFNSLRAAGERYDIHTSALAQQAAATKGEDAKKIGIGAGAGAAIGAIFGGGGGAAKGAVIGGAGGTGVVLATRGKEVHLGPGAEVTTKLTAPLTVRVPA